MADRAGALLASLNVPIDIEQQLVTATSPGAGIFLLAEYDQLNASFSGLGRRGKPAELVAEEAVAALREHHASGAAIELHLADQLLLPLAFASGTSTFTAARPTRHFLTNAGRSANSDSPKLRSNRKRLAVCGLHPHQEAAMDHASIRAKQVIMCKIFTRPNADPSMFIDRIHSNHCIRIGEGKSAWCARFFQCFQQCLT
jgi:hypothetical protein